MYRYHEVEDDERFEYGVVSYLDGDEESVASEGYLLGEVMDGTEQPVVTVVEPERTVRIPFARVWRIRYSTE